MWYKSELVELDANEFCKTRNFYWVSRETKVRFPGNDFNDTDVK